MRISIEWLKDFVDFDFAPPDLAEALVRIGIGVEKLESWGEDWILDLEITPNRPDLLSVSGIAREISVITGNPLRFPEEKVVEKGVPVQDLAKITLEDPEDCPRYASRVLTGVKVKPSPSWMSQRLEKTGLRSVNNIVDATNYTLLERGHPLHAFDFEKLANHSIHVRRAKEGESLVTLDGVQRTLNSEILLICDGKGAVALAGIMGGAETEISLGTTNVLIESAYFDPVTIRRGARKLGLGTEASYRFERKANIEEIILSLNRAASLMREIGEGEVAQGVIDVYPHPIPQKTITLRIKRLQEILGVPVEEKETEKILTGLGFEVVKPTSPSTPITNHEPRPYKGRGESPITIHVPSFRRDCHREIDLIEEVARILGYDAIPSHLSRGGRYVGRPDERERLVQEIQDALLGNGFTQIRSIPLLSPEDSERFTPIGLKSKVLRLRNPLSRDFSILQTSLLPGILHTLLRNQSKGLPIRGGQENLGIFEIGKIFYKLEAESKKQPESGRFTPHASPYSETHSLLLARLENPGEGKGFSILKGVLETLFKKFKLAEMEWHPLETDHSKISNANSKVLNANFKLNLFTSHSSLILHKSETLGLVGEVSKRFLEDLGLKGEVAIGELHLDKFHQMIPKETFFTPLPKYPPIERDLS
ncbi:phenylalanine--tRNA ligase subunit beta, partial [candidate division TA06 bacterium]|nr:phenylalanine--tRNA ligase subunit beta [candidate division TA06 bacterium]